MGISHPLSVGTNNHAVNSNTEILGATYVDIAARDADSTFNTNSANVGLTVKILTEPTSTYYLLTAITPTFVQTAWPSYQNLAARDADTAFHSLFTNVNKIVRVEDADGLGTIGYFFLASITPLWEGLGASLTDTFLELTDTPSSYASQAGNVVQVNAGQTALEFGQATLYGGDGTINGVTRTVSVENLGALIFETFDTNTSTFVIGSELSLSPLIAILNVLNGDGAGSITDRIELKLQSTSGAIFTDSTFSKGLVYAADYSSNFTDRSLVDKAYVDTGAGKVSGPASATDNALARFDLTTGKLIQNSLAILPDTGVLSGLTQLLLADNASLVLGTGSDLTIVHTGVLSSITNNVGDLVLDNTSVFDDIVNRLGTDTSTTSFDVRNNSDINILRILGSGFVGVGIDVPISKFHVLEATTFTGSNAGITVQQSGSGDALLQYFLTNGQRWITGIDNSDSDKYKIASSVDLNSDARLTIETGGNVGIGIIAPVSLLHVSEDTTFTGSNAGITIDQDGIGDAVLQYLLTAGQRWVAGVDNSDGDKYKIASSVDLDSNAHFTIDINGRVGIGTTSPDSSAKLDISSVTQGFLPPRMTTTQRDAISSPATGLEIFNTTTNLPQFFDGSVWTPGTLGDVVGPASATDNALVRFDATTGKLIQNSGIVVTDSNSILDISSIEFSDESTQQQASLPDGILGSLTTALFKQPFTLTQSLIGQGIFFRPNGTTFFSIDNTNTTIEIYSLSTPWDISTISHVTGQVIPSSLDIRSLFIRQDGLKLYVMSNSVQNELVEFDLSTAWDITTLSLVDPFVVFENATPRGTWFNGTGSKLYISGATAPASVFEYTLTIPWDITTASVNFSFDISSIDTAPHNITFLQDGTKMYVVGDQNDSIYEFDLSDPWDLSTAVLVKTISISAQTTNPTGLFLRPEATKLYLADGSASSILFEFDMGITTAFISSPTGIVSLQRSAKITDDALVFFDDSQQVQAAIPDYISGDISTVKFTGRSFSVATQSTDPSSVFFKPDGLRMIVVSLNNDTLFEYNLSTAWDVSTAAIGVNFVLGTEAELPRQLFIRSDGLKLFLADSSLDQIVTYDFGTAWDISTLVHSGELVSTTGSNPLGLFFRPDGTFMYVADASSALIEEYALSTPWDLSTAVDTTVTKATSPETVPRGVCFNNNGRKMYVSGSGTDSVSEFEMDNPWDIANANFILAFDINNEDTFLNNTFFRSDMQKMYTVGFSNLSIYEYDIGRASLVGVTTTPIFSISDFPAAVAGVITLTSGVYAFMNSVTTSDRFVGASGANVTFESSDHDNIILTFTASNTLYTNATNGHFNIFSLPIKLEGNNATLLSITGGEVYIRDSNIDFTGTGGTIGTLTSTSRVNIDRHVNIIGFENGITLTNTGLVLFEDIFLDSNSSGAGSLITINGTYEAVGGLSLTQGGMVTNAAESVFDIGGSLVADSGNITINTFQQLGGLGDYYESGSLDQTTPNILVSASVGSPDSKTIGSLVVGGNATVTTIVTQNVFELLDLGSPGAVGAGNIERFTVTNATTGEMRYDGIADVSLNVTGLVAASSSGGGQRFNFRALVNGLTLASPDAVDVPIEVGNDLSATALAWAVEMENGDLFRVEVENADGTSNITIDTYKITIT